MCPTLFGIKTYTVLYGLSMVAHLVLARRLCRRRGLPVKLGVFLGACYAFGMTVGAKILFDLLQGSFAGLDYLRPAYYIKGGLWGGPLAYFALGVPTALLVARDRRAALDVVALALPVPMILAKLGCFCNGCCYGAASSLPWAVVFPEGAEAPAGIARHPTQLYEILVLLVIMVVLRLLDSPAWRGLLIGWFVAIYGVGRPLTELFRDDHATCRSQALPTLGPFTASQSVCLAAALLALGTVLVLRRARRVLPGRV